MADSNRHKHDVLLSTAPSIADQPDHGLIDTGTDFVAKEQGEHLYRTSRETARQILSSKTGHYFILALVVLNVTGIFAATFVSRERSHLVLTMLILRDRPFPMWNAVGWQRLGWRARSSRNHWARFLQSIHARIDSFKFGHGAWSTPSEFN